MDNKQEQPYEIFIPENYKTKSNFLGFEVKIANVIEGFAFALIPVLIGIFLLPKIPIIDSETNLSITTTFAFAFGLFGFIGIDDELVITWLLDILKFKQSRRIAYYNPRVKKEAHSIFAENDKQDMLPREKIIKLYENYKAQLDNKNRELAHEQEKQFDQAETMYFEDDLGFINKPFEYMTAKEKKKFKKEERKRMKANGKK